MVLQQPCLFVATILIYKLLFIFLLQQHFECIDFAIKRCCNKMTLLTKKEFSEKCGIPTNALAVYVKRSKVELTGELVNDELEVNKAFYLKKLAKIDKEPETKLAILEQKSVFESERNDINESELLVPDENQTFIESERQLKYLDTVKRAKEIELKDIEIAKKRGELIPTDLIKSLIIQHSESIKVSLGDFIENFIVVISSKKQLTNVEVADIRSQLTSIRNKAIDDAINASKKNLKNIVKEYSDKKGIGQKT